MKLLDLKRLKFSLWSKKKAGHFGSQTVENIEKDVEEQIHDAAEGLVPGVSFYILLITDRSTPGEKSAILRLPSMHLPKPHICHSYGQARNCQPRVSPQDTSRNCAGKTQQVRTGTFLLYILSWCLSTSLEVPMRGRDLNVHHLPKNLWVATLDFLQRRRVGS